MHPQIKESDWKLLRRLTPVALERFCRSALAEINRVTSDSGEGYHERFLEVFYLVNKLNDELGRAFDDHRRSNARQKLTVIMQGQLLTAEEFSRFSPETREAVNVLLKIFGQ